MNTSLIKQIKALNNIEQELILLSNTFENNITLSSSFGIEDQVITHFIYLSKLNNLDIFTLDTGRLFRETYDVWYKTELQYKIKIKAFYPDSAQIVEYVNSNGINAFYDSQDLRKSCCFIRKVEPLNRALKDVKVWITGLRAEQSDNRNQLKKLEWDSERQLYKYNPLINWTTDDVVTYLRKNGVPFNVLHDQNFVSIGCAPCTRAVTPGENFRAGRWWWEDQSKKECGLHR
jgi:phosphoadenosine phosphosulfate reductase